MLKRLSRRKVQEEVSKEVDIANVSTTKNGYIVEFYYKNFYRNIDGKSVEAIKEKISETVMDLKGGI